MKFAIQLGKLDKVWSSSRRSSGTPVAMVWSIHFLNVSDYVVSKVDGCGLWNEQLTAHLTRDHRSAQVIVLDEMVKDFHLEFIRKAKNCLHVVGWIVVQEAVHCRVGVLVVDQWSH